MARAACLGVFPVPKPPSSGSHGTGYAALRRLPCPEHWRCFGQGCSSHARGCEKGDGTNGNTNAGHARTHARTHAVIVAAESARLAAWHFCGGAAQTLFHFSLFSDLFILLAVLMSWHRSERAESEISVPHCRYLPRSVCDLFFSLLIQCICGSIADSENLGNGIDIRSANLLTVWSLVPVWAGYLTLKSPRIFSPDFSGSTTPWVFGGHAVSNGIGCKLLSLTSHCLNKIANDGLHE